MAFEKINEFAADKQKLCVEHDTISDELFREYGVNRGLRDINGKGVLTGLTRISKVVSFKDENGEHVPCDGELWYRGYNINTLIKNLDGFGFEKTAYLLIFGEMPTAQQLAEFNDVLTECRTLPSNFTRDVIMKAPSKDIMNSMTKSILTLSSYDDDIASNSIDNCIRQCLQLTAVFPMLAVYGYHAYNHYENDDSMYIHRPTTGLSTAENFLRLLRPDMQYTELEARVLDIVLMLHMEHGGGNNSTFTCRTVSSSGTDAYSAYAAAIGSLKGPRHGGANIKVMEMLDFAKAGIKNWDNDQEVSDYLHKLLRKEAGDHSGLIYGMGHAVYTLSDPRAKILKANAMKLAKGTEFEKEFLLLDSIERLTPGVFADERGDIKNICANVDMYSGLVYKMLKIPVEMYTGLFACARISGWCAHRMEEMINGKRIIRPAYKAINLNKNYIPLSQRI